MAVITWLLLSLLIVQTVAGRGLRERDFRDDRDILQPLFEELGSKRLARGHRKLQSELEDWTPLRARRTESIGEESCGEPAIPPSTSVRVVGGVEAVPHSWPWMVSLQADGRHFCGGSLINNQWVVTAAHCQPGFKTAGINESVVVVGQHRISQPDQFTIRVPVSKVIMNQKFNRPGRMLTSDIMLLKLAHPVEFNDAVSPVCLPEPQFRMLPGGKRCHSSGWGTLTTGGESPDQLMQVMLPLIDNEVCNQPGWHNHKLDDSMVCAGFQQGEMGNCHGDSGGPLVCRDGGHWILYGVVSWGSTRGCAITNGPTVYARASAYTEWIDEMISENSD